MSRTIIGHYASVQAADSAVEELAQAGFTKEQVSYVAQDRGGPSGSSLGVAPIVIPGVGPAVAGGPVASALVGGSTAGLLGALSDMGVPHRDAQRWVERAADGGALVIVRAEDGALASAAEIVRRGADEVQTHGGEGERTDAHLDDRPDAHADFENYGSDGGSSQWGQRVLRVDDNDEVVVTDRTISRDKGSDKSKG